MSRLDAAAIVYEEIADIYCVLLMTKAYTLKCLHNIEAKTPRRLDTGPE